jgi:hypothetical protein
MAFDRAAAKASGYSDEEIDAYLQANPHVAKETPPAPVSADTPPPPSTEVPDINRTAEALATAGLGAGNVISGVGGAVKDLIAPAASAYGAYKLGQVANSAINRFGQGAAANPVPQGPVAPNIGTPGNPIGAQTARTVPVSGAVAPEGVPIQRVAQQAATTAAAPAEASMMARAGQMASQYAPAMRAGLGMAGRLAGPAGLAYSLYQAAPELHAAGQQLNLGQAQQRMRQAQQAPLTMPTPAPLSAQEANNLLASGDERTINIYGGRQKLMSIANPNALNSGFAQQLNRMGR